MGQIWGATGQRFRLKLQRISYFVAWILGDFTEISAWDAQIPYAPSTEFVLLPLVPDPVNHAFL